jgi:hypothetical protein
MRRFSTVDLMIKVACLVTKAEKLIGSETKNGADAVKLFTVVFNSALNYSLT